MFNIDVVKVILASKESKLTELSGAQNIDQAAIDNLKAEIEYLKLVVVRYEIAKLLGLDSDQNYIKSNFYGVESEDVNAYNLSAEDMARYNELMNQIPVSQVQRSKMRRDLLKMINKNLDEKITELRGVEELNPEDDIYRLTEDEQDDFFILAGNMRGLDPDNTKEVNIRRETSETIKSIFVKLNINDRDEYERIKESNLEDIDTLLTSIPDYEHKVFFTGVLNPNLAADLGRKYPNLDVRLSLNGINNLVRKLEGETLDEENYNYYLELLSKNIKKSYEDETKRADIERILNSISEDNYTLRNDVSSKIQDIENVDLSIKFDELSTIYKELDENYDNLDENKREKYYAIVVALISGNIANLDKIDDINKLFMGTKNKELNSRIQGKFSSNKIAKFQKRHFTSYQDLVADRIRKLEAKKSKYASKNAKTELGNVHNDTRVKEIEKEIERLREIEKNYDKNPLIKGLDKNYNKKTDKIIKLEKDLAELKTLKQQVRSKFRKKLIDWRIKRISKKIAKLEKSRIKIVGRQKKIMMPKLWFSEKKGFVGRGYESKAEVFTTYAEDYREMAQTERQLHGMFSGIKAAFYERKARRFEKKAEFNRRMLERLNRGRVTVQGANQQNLPADVLAQVRQNQQQQVAVQTI